MRCLLGSFFLFRLYRMFNRFKIITDLVEIVTLFSRFGMVGFRRNVPDEILKLPQSHRQFDFISTFIR